MFSRPLLALVFCFYAGTLLLLSLDLHRNPVEAAENEELQSLRAQLKTIRRYRSQAEVEFQNELDALLHLRTPSQKEPASKDVAPTKEPKNSAVIGKEKPVMSQVEKLLNEQLAREMRLRERRKVSNQSAIHPPPLKSNATLTDSATTRYLETHTSFPVVLLCYNREQELKTTLESLLSVRGVRKEDVIAVQDGTKLEVAQVLEKNDIFYLQRPEEPKTIPPIREKKKKIEPGDKIARHYGYALHKAFEHFFDAPGIVIIEDDFLFSPDFMEFFVSVAPTIEVDPSLWLASAWNDNGFEGVVKDLEAVRRTDHFPG